ncbi:protein adenylyltransferase SelO [Xylophilus ampelinus]|nr:YdiU family protein [Xylophilus ampelinus]MCS4509730.1 YdiU family protein [Xylophilus ampelinus]
MTPFTAASTADPPRLADAPADGATDLGLAWQPGFAALGTGFLTQLPARQVAPPYLVDASPAVAAMVGLEPDAFADPAVLEVFAGNRPAAGTASYATVYSGHQFGVWAGQLGDGRALTLGQTASGLEIQLKGAGPTPYSRGGDGRAVLRSSIREFLCSEAMHGLGIPTTRALCIVGSDTPVRRETTETAAIVARVAPSFVRFGHFEHFAARGQIDDLRRLADHVIDRHYPQCRGGADLGGNPYAAMLKKVSLRTADMVAQWQAVGFCHGVMNTDNMSILGLTIDYGPFQFLDGFDPAHICNHSDTQGRYAFNQQPNIAYWNLFCLGQALMPLIDDEKIALEALESYRSAFPAAYLGRMRAKLGLTDARETDADLVDGLLKLLAAERTDWTIFWRRLSHHVTGNGGAPVQDMAIDRTRLDAWLLQYSERLAGLDRGLAGRSMIATNPRFVLRNHLGEQAIRQAKLKDFSEVHTLRRLLAAPCDEHPGSDAYAGFPPDWASSIEISCSS